MIEKNDLIKIKEIRNWIKENYPESCIAVNDANNGVPSDDCVDDNGNNELLQSAVEFFLYEIMGFCGCGTQIISIMAVKCYLEVVKVNHEKDKGFDIGRKMLLRRFHVRDVCSDPLLQYMAYDLDDRGLTEHGSSIRGAWLEELGEKCLDLFTIYLKYEKKSCEETNDENNNCDNCNYRNLCI